MRRAQEHRHGHRKPILITGGAGFIGCNLADRLAARGQQVLIFDALTRPGVSANIDWLTRRHGGFIDVDVADIRDGDAVQRAVGASRAVFHFAAQVAVTVSLDEPLVDHDTNVTGTLNVLDAARRNGRPPVIVASTNKVYGDLAGIALEQVRGRYMPCDAQLAQFGISEAQPLSFHTPYGCSKGAADQYALDYARSYDLPAAVMRMSCIYGPRQFGLEDQGWVAHFVLKALRGEEISLYGDGHQVRDVLYIDDCVDAYIALLAQIGACRGNAYNLGGGPANAVSLREVIDEICRLLGRPVNVSDHDWRAGDQKYFVADTRKIRRALGLGSPIDWREGLRRLALWASELVIGTERSGAALAPNDLQAAP